MANGSTKVVVSVTDNATAKLKKINEAMSGFGKTTGAAGKNVSQLSKLEANLSKLGSTASNAFGSLAKTFGPAGVLASVGSVSGLVAMARATADLNLALSRQAAFANTSTTALQRYKTAGAAIGVGDAYAKSIAGIEKIRQRMAIRSPDTAEQQGAAKAAGLNFAGKNSEQIMEMLGDFAKKKAGEGVPAELLADFLEKFGVDREMVPDMMKSGGKGLKQKADAIKLHPVTKDDSAASEESQKDATELDAALHNLQVKISTYIEPMKHKLTELGIWLTDAAADNPLVAILGGLSASFVAMKVGFSLLAATLSKLGITAAAAGAEASAAATAAGGGVAAVAAAAAAAARLAGPVGVAAAIMHPSATNVGEKEFLEKERAKTAAQRKADMDPFANVPGNDNNNNGATDGGWLGHKLDTLIDSIKQLFGSGAGSGAGYPGGDNPNSGGNPNGNFTPAMAAETRQKITDAYRTAGYDDNAIAAVIGNWSQESSLNHLSGIGTQHVGLAQWDATRQRQFQSVFGHRIEQSTPDEQIAFSIRELALNPDYAETERALRDHTKSGAEKASVYNKNFERSGDSDTPRIANTQRALPLIQQQPVQVTITHTSDAPNSKIATTSNTGRVNVKQNVAPTFAQASK